MVILPEMLTFDWDEGNREKNQISHGIMWIDAEEVFFNRPLMIHSDEGHSKVEARYQALGRTNKDRKVFVVFTIRKNKIRIISIRDMNKKEKAAYEQN